MIPCWNRASQLKLCQTLPLTDGDRMHRTGRFLWGSGRPWTSGTLQCRGFCYLGSNLSHPGHHSERTGCPCSSPAPFVFPAPPRQPTPTLQAGVHKPDSHVRHVFNSFTICYLVKKIYRSSNCPGRPVSRCLRCSGPQTLSGRFSGLEAAILHLGWVGAWPRSLATEAVGSTLASGLVTWELEGSPSAGLQCCLLGSHSEIFTYILLLRGRGSVEASSGQMNQDCLTGGWSVYGDVLNAATVHFSLPLWLNALSSDRATSPGPQTCFGASRDTGWAFPGRLEVVVRRSDRPLYWPL